MVVLAILGFLAAMLVPAVGFVDDAERARRTRKQMEIIRAAILGPEDRFDAQSRPVIGGYVGDMRTWPDLWEARAEIKPGVIGVSWDNPSTILGAQVGQGPEYKLDPNLVFFRPSGTFGDGRWKWHRPYRKLYDDNATHRDHIGGLETENEGQPRGLWTRYVEDLPFDLGEYKAPGQVLDGNWKGPYLAEPWDQSPADAEHWAVSDQEFKNLQPRWNTALNNATWEDGDYNPLHGHLGEFYDDKESFRLLQTDGRLADGWGRALRFFITADPDYPGGTIFWILSEGPDYEAFYPTKGRCAGHTWSVNANDIMARAYNPDHPKNRDNIVMKLHSRDWQGLFDAEDQRKTLETESILARIHAALVGDAPFGLNPGYTGDVCAWPALFNWDNATGAWVKKAGGTLYTIGQPRGLWTRTPGAVADSLNASRFGVGWRHAYLGEPHGAGKDNALRDAWGRELLFFRDDARDALLVLSRGADGKYTFGDTDPSFSEPVNYTQALDVSAYNATAALNVDNRHIILRGLDWRQGFFKMYRFVVLRADATTKARFFVANQEAQPGVDLLEPSTLTDEDGDGNVNDWATDSSTGQAALSWSDLSPTNATTGSRYLVFWNDANGDNNPDSGEHGQAFIFPVTGMPGSGLQQDLRVDASQFKPLP